MNKTELINKISENININRDEIKKIIDETIKIAKEELSNDRNLSLSGFGALAILKRKERITKIPGKKEPMKVSEKRYVKFKSSKNFLKYINGT